MIRKIVLILATISAVFSISACNTMQGAGRDVEKAGEKIQKEAVEHKKY